MARRPAASKKGTAEEIKKEKKEAPGIEESFRMLDELLSKMEDEDTPLEEAFSLYEKGLGLVKNAGAQIDRIEHRLQILGEDEEEAESHD